MKYFDSIEFRLIDPAEAGELWALQWGHTEDAVEVIINGEDIIDIVLPLVLDDSSGVDDSDNAVDFDAFDDYDDIPDVDDEEFKNVYPFGHLSPAELLQYIDISEGNRKDSYLLQCGDCGDIDCDSILCDITADDKFVRWNRFYRVNYPEKTLNLEFTFDRRTYDEQIAKLREMSIMPAKNGYTVDMHNFDEEMDFAGNTIQKFVLRGENPKLEEVCFGIEHIVSSWEELVAQVLDIINVSRSTSDNSVSQADLKEILKDREVPLNNLLIWVRNYDYQVATSHSE